MTDRAAIAAARADAEAVEAEARALGERLIAAKANLHRLRRELEVLPRRVGDLQAAVAAAKARADAAAQARAQVAAQQAAAQAQAAAADAEVASLGDQIAQAQAELQDLLDLAGEAAGPRPLARPPIEPNGGGGGRPSPILLQRIRQKQQQIAGLQASLAAAQGRANAARQQVAALTAQVGTADAAVQAVQADVAAAATQLAQAQAALDADTAALPAAEALPGELRSQIGAVRDRVAAAWEPWRKLLAEGHAEVAAAAAARDAATARAAAAATAGAGARKTLAQAERSGDAQRVRAAQADVTAADAAVAAAREAVTQTSAAVDAARADLVDGDDPDELAQLIAADVPVVLLPVRLETCFEPHDTGGNLLVRIYPDTVHVFAHEPELTEEELTWGRHFLEQEEAAGDDTVRRAAWAQLAGRFGPQRAGWVARAVQAAKPGDPPRRSGAWTRPPTSLVLPDRWIALGYRAGTRRFSALGAPIADTVVVGPDPGETAPDPTALLGEAARWLLDFERALEAGMALRIPLDADDVHGLDRLVVLGARTSLGADESAARLAALLDGHHYTDGLALVPAGAPTNNTASVRAAWSSNDEGYARSWETERGAPLTQRGDGSDADRLASALGLEGETFAHAGHADERGGSDAQQMATALWPATWGYALEQLLGSVPDAALGEARAHFIAHVRARGPLAGLRLGRQPYGLLPATSLQRWALLDPADVDAALPPILRALVPVWRAAATSVPRVTADAAIDQVLSGALTMSPVSVRYAARNVALHPHADDGDAFARRQQALALPRTLDLDIEPRLADAGFELGATDLTGPLVAAAASETDPLPDDSNYVRWLAESGWEAVRAGAPPGGGNTLLFALLRHALLRQYAGTALRILRARSLAEPGEGAEPGLRAAGPSPWDRLQAPVADLTGGHSLGEYLDGVRAGSSGSALPETVELAELQAALVQLAGLPSAVLERLLAETLDLCSHRLDAWMTAHANRRLEELRARRPNGVRLGGYGVLYDVRPAPVRTLAEQVAQLQAELAAARQSADAGAQSRAQVAAQQAAAQAQATTADAAVASLNAQIACAQAELDAMLEAAAEAGGPRPLARPPIEPNGGGGGGPSPALLRRIHEKQQQIAGLQGSLAAAEAAAGAAGHALAVVTAQAAAADAALRAAQATVARVSAQLAATQVTEQNAIELATNKGFIHAPSLGQAATAAVLRSGHLAHRREADTAFSIDLSSLRVRLALNLLDGVRQGQPLGALLGYRFERGLHEGHPGLSLDRYIAILRALAPLDDSSRAEAELRDALARQADIAARLGALEQQLAAAKAADQAAKDTLRHDLATAQAQLDVARTSALALAAQLEHAQATLQALLDRVGEAEQPSRIPPWKLPNGDFPGAGIPPALLAQIHNATAEVRRLSTALDAANAAAAAAAARVGDISAQLGVADPRIATLEQAVTDLQPELDAANTAVTAARAKLDELRGKLREQAAEAVQANNVVDGLALRRRWRSGTRDGRWDTSTIPFGDADIGLPALGTAEQAAVDAELRALDDAVDALGDLLTAESVHQLVQGNSTRAGATVDALSRGEAPPPEPEIARTPRAGIGVSHRLLVLLDPDGPAAEGWPTDETQLRAKLEPALEAWVARLLGPADRVRVRARYSWPGNEASAEADLSVLRISALDVCAAAVAAPAGATELELRLLDHFAVSRPDGVPADGAVVLMPERDPAWGTDVLGLGELMEVARQVRELLVGARAADARDLSLPGETPDPGVDAADLADRAATALNALEEAHVVLKTASAGTELRATLLRASAVGVPGAVPVAAPTDTPALLAQAGAVGQELERRRAAAAEAADDAARIAAVLGPEWRVLPRMTPARDDELRAAFASSNELQDGDPLAAVTWLERAAHVRDGVARLAAALVYAETLGSPERLDLRVAQLPHRAGDRWVGLPATAEHPIEGGRLSLVVQAAEVPLGGPAPLVGLVLDEWTEVVPAATQVTGLSFHFDQPNSRAPQAILLAVPPTEAAVWNLDSLEAVVLETLELVELRLADPEALARASGTSAMPGTGHYLPAIYLASGPAEETVSTDLERVTAPVPA
jgi:hypothetical protein